MDAAKDAAKSGPRWSCALALCLGLALVLCAGAFDVHNLDLPLHVVTGQWMLEHGQVPHTNVMSELHHDDPSVHDKWGFQVLAFLIQDGAGVGAFVALRMALLLILFGALAATARTLGATPGATLLFLSLALVASRSRFLARPDLISLALLAVFAWMALARRPDGRGLLRWLLPLQILWVNLHGYFLLGWLTVGAVAVGHLLSGRPGRATGLRFLGVATVLALACLANPSGLAGWLHPFEILADLRAHAELYRSGIEEFLPTFATDPRLPWDRLACLTLGGLALLSLGSAVVVDRRRVTEGGEPSRAWLLPACVLLLLFGSMLPSLRRNMATFALVLAAPAAAALPKRVGGSASLLGLGAGVALLACVGEVTDATSIHDGLQRRAGFGRSSLAYPDMGIDFIARERPTGKVFTAFRYGSSFTGARWPQQVASTNGNTHGYPTAWLERVLTATADSDPDAFERLVDEHGFDTVLVPMQSPLAARLLRDPRWALVCLGGEEAVFVLRSSAHVDWLTAHDLAVGLAAGTLPNLPVAEARPAWGVARPAGPSHRAAVLCLAGGYPQVALGLALRSAAETPGDSEALALAGLLSLRRGDPEAGRALLLRSREIGRIHPLAADVDAALSGADQPSR